MSFRVQAKDLLGRIGALKTKSGVLTTPHMFPVLDPFHRIDRRFFEDVGINAVMTNAYLLKRGQRASEIADVHKTLGFDQIVATDSGAYQILEYGQVGVKPDEIVRYQESINSDIGVILDVPTGFRSDPARARWTVDETVARADQALRSMTRTDILWIGPIQGGVHLQEVERSAAKMSQRDFPIYALGSPTELMESQRYDVLVDMILTAKRVLPKSKPFHLFGAGHPVLFPFLVALGCDLFDSAGYVLYARAGRYFTSDGTQLLADMVEFACACPACVGITPREVLNSVPRERESRLVRHNLWSCFSELRRIREAIRKGRLWELLELRSRVHPALTDCFDRLRSYSRTLERFTPVVKPRGIFHLGVSTEDRPEALRYRAGLRHSVHERGRDAVVLPGRWRRPFHEDPRYHVVTESFEDYPSVSICFYSFSWGPVPIELDEMFPIAQTEGRDRIGSDSCSSNAKYIASFVKTLRPRGVVVVSVGDYGRHVSLELKRTLGERRVVVIHGDRLKPLAIVSSIRKRLARVA